MDQQYGVLAHLSTQQNKKNKQVLKIHRNTGHLHLMMQT